MRLRYRREALRDLAAIHDYLAAEHPTAASAVIRRIRRAVERLSRIPRSGRNGAVAGTREVVIPGLPYIAVYRLEDEAVDVIAVFHAAQDR